MQQSQSINEKSLFTQIAKGDEHAFKQIFGHYGKLLYPFLFRIVKSNAQAEELIQEVMLRIWLKRDQLTEVEFPRQWIFKIASNLASTALTRRLKEADVVSIYQSGNSSAAEEPSLQLNELKREIKFAINQLPEQRRRIYLLSREAGMSREEIAEHLEISPSTVKNSMTIALKSIREHLEKTGFYLPLFFISLLRL